jgi:hypothetical protein
MTRLKELLLGHRNGKAFVRACVVVAAGFEARRAGLLAASEARRAFATNGRASSSRVAQLSQNATRSAGNLAQKKQPVRSPDPIQDSASDDCARTAVKTTYSSRLASPLVLEPALHRSGNPSFFSTPNRSRRHCRDQGGLQADRGSLPMRLASRFKT